MFPLQFGWHRIVLLLLNRGSPVTLNEVADLVVSPEAEALSRGNYLNRRGILGYYLQLKCGSNWCKVSVSHADRHRTTVTELDEIDPNTLQPAVIIPVSSIAAALKSPAAEQAPTSSYLNNAGVEGIWAEFYYQGNWYMVGVSHVDVPAYATPDDLERIADELLWQQGQRKYRRRIS
jgi:hypothetical protein